LTQYFDEQQERRRIDMASVSVSSAAGYGWSSSGYVTCSSLSDEDVVVMNGEEEDIDCIYSRKTGKKEMEEERMHPGICPHCKFIYEKPVTLRCGHSLCDECCTQLLSRMENTSVPRTRPRMGISSYSRSSLNKSMACSWNSLNGVCSLWKSPRCPLCGESPKKTAPIPNLSLQDFLTTIRLPPALRHLNEREKKECAEWSPGLSLTPSSLSPSLSPSLSTPMESSRILIRDCLVSIVGSRGVGKSCLLQTQLCNDLLIDELLDRQNETPFSHERRGIRYMLKLHESEGVCDKIEESMGVVVMYSVVQRESFEQARGVLTQLTRERGNEVPIIVVGAKSDLEKRRQVRSYEGQMIAKQFNCPFIEVSSRRNECVNEAFVELVRVMESRNLLN
ncbi:hypothetical protein PMAYCL1PPCAC_18262, partial [Pristionchus mayeri]